MAMVRCDQGHFYNPDNHSGCPHCGPGLAEVDTGHLEKTRPVDAPPTSPGVEGATVRRPGGPVGGAPPSGTAQDAKTRSAWSTREQSDGTPAAFMPVTGWLVCLEGADRGRDFRLQPEGNFIGRGPENDVVIANDDAISRDKHAEIFYDPEERIFVLSKGEKARGALRLNGRAVFQPTPVKARDVIGLGDTSLLFVPLCSDDFDWDKQPVPVEPEAE